MANLKPGRQLDALVAEKMGWTDINPEMKLDGPDKHTLRVATAPDGHTHYIPHYSTDIASAWQVVDHIRKLDGENGQRWHWHIQEIPCMNWMASVNDEKAFVLREGKERYEAEGDTAQHAICLLALDVMEAMAA